MFCHNCGAKLPENARFCPACGTMTLHSQEKPTAQNIHTAPIQREQPRPQPVQPPVEQPRPQPVQPPVEQPRPQEQIPTNDASAHNPQPVRPNPAPAPNPKKPKMPKKKGSKLPILLALIAAIGTLVFFVSKKEPEVTVDQYKPRYDSQSFLFTHEEFVAIYNDLLEENDIPIKIAGIKEERDNRVERSLTKGLKQVGYISTTIDPETGKIITVSATTNTDYEKKMSSSTKAALELLFEAAIGPLSQEELQAIRQMPLVLEGEDTYIYTTKLGNVGLERWHVPDIYSMTATFETDNWQFEGTQPEETAEAEEPVETEEPEQTLPETTYTSLSAMEKYPEGEYRFDEEGFFFDHQEFADLFQYQMALDGIDYTLAKPTISNTGSIYYGLRNGESEIGLLLLQVNDAGRITRMAYHYEYSGDKNLDTQGVAAGLSFLQAGHGAMTNDRWSSMVGAETDSENENHTSYSYDMDGLKIRIRKEKEGIRYMISADQ